MEQQPTPPVQEQEIDLIELAQHIWKERKFILKACGIGVLIGLVVAFSIPKEYKTTVKLSPENSDGGGNKLGGMSGLAAMAGINIGNISGGSDALTPELYPDIVASTPFLLELIPIEVETKDGKLKTTFYEYMTKHQRAPWWSSVIGAPIKLLGWGMSLFKDKEDAKKELVIDSFNLTAKQEQFVKSMQQTIFVNTDKKTSVLSVSISMQDPLVSASILDVVLTKLQEYITDYRTRKAKHDLAFTEKLYSEAKESYFKAQKEYAGFTDENRNIISARYKTEEERLKNEMTLAYNVYNQMAQQLEMNRVKVQEVTPVYTVIEPVRMSQRADKPSKPIILIGFVFLAGFVSVFVIFFKYIYINRRVWGI